MSNSENCSDGCLTAIRRDLFMPEKIIILSCITLTGIGFIQSCGPSASEMAYREKSQSIANSIAAYAPGLATDTIQGITHNFMRSADLKFKVSNILEASHRIEDLVIKKGGYVSLSDFSSIISYSTSVKFKEDSLLESIHYTTVNAITLRIPNKELDTVVRAISNIALFIDYRKIKADDAKMTLYANSLAEKRYSHSQARLEKSVVNHKKAIKQRLRTEELLLEKQTLADNAHLDSYDLADKVNYATLVLELYQPQQMTTSTIAVPAVVEPFVPSFFQQLQKSILKGFGLLKSCFLFLMSSWGLIVCFIVFFLIFKKSRSYFLQKLAAGTK